MAVVIRDRERAGLDLLTHRDLRARPAGDMQT